MKVDVIDVPREEFDSMIESMVDLRDFVDWFNEEFKEVNEELEKYGLCVKVGRKNE